MFSGTFEGRRGLLASFLLLGKKEKFTKQKNLPSFLVIEFCLWTKLENPDLLLLAMVKFFFCGQNSKILSEY